jgi:hypothetical protein
MKIVHFLVLTPMDKSLGVKYVKCRQRYKATTTCFLLEDKLEQTHGETIFIIY